jgi:hypothetical protein
MPKGSDISPQSPLRRGLAVVAVLASRQAVRRHGSVSPIAEFLAERLTEQLAAEGVRLDRVTVVSGEAERWHYEIVVEGRSFDFGFNHRERLWCREVTPGHEQALVSNDEPGIATSPEAWHLALQRIRCALRTPRVIQREPPII